MLAVNYSTIRSKLKDYCDKVTDEYETVIVTRKDEKNVVILSLEEYNSLIKAAKKPSYLEIIDSNDRIPEHKLTYIISFLRGFQLDDEIEDDLFCEAMYQDYLKNSTAEDKEVVSIEEAAKMLGVDL